MLDRPHRISTAIAKIIHHYSTFLIRAALASVVYRLLNVLFEVVRFKRGKRLGTIETFGTV